MTTSAKTAVLAKITALHGATQDTYVDARGSVRATLSATADGVRIDLDWVGAGTDAMPRDVYDDLASYSDTDELEEAIREVFGADVDVDVDVEWHQGHATVDVAVDVRTTPRHGDGGGIRIRASSTRDDLVWRDCGASADVRASVIDSARRGEDVTGHDDLAAADDRIEDDTRAALCRLGDAIGY